jgi:hypothetical protein
MRIAQELFFGVVFAATVGFAAAPLRASIYDESDIADLSNNKAFPTPFTLTLGSNSILGTVNGTNDLQDWIAITVPPGMEMTSYVNAVYNNPNDVQAFTGFQFGSTFPGNAFSAGSYAGYAHFGTGAQNGTGPNAPNGGAAQTTVGVDLFSPLYFPNNASGGTAAGSTGFTPPLGPGTYTFLIQQQGTLTGYEFDMNVSPLPEPATFWMGAAGGLALVAAAARMRRAVDQ